MSNKEKERKIELRALGWLFDETNKFAMSKIKVKEY